MATQSRCKIIVFAANGAWKWKVVNRGKVIARCAEPYSKKHYAVRAAEALGGHVAQATVVVDE